MGLRRRYRSAPLRIKMFVPVTTVVIAAFACIALVASLVMQTQLREYSQRSGLEKADLAEIAVRRAMLTGKPHDTETVLRSLGDSPAMPRIALRTTDGRYVADVRESGYAFVKHLDYPPPGSPRSRRISANAQSYLRVTHAIPNESACYQCHVPSQTTLGYLEVDVSTTWLMRRHRQSIFLIAAVAGLTLVCVWLAVTVAVNMAVLSPLLTLGRAMSGVKRGQRNIRFEAETSDEIGRLGRHFNEMIDEIATAESSLVEKERQLAEAEKLASVGLMAAGIAHEINNPLAAASVAAEMLNIPGLTEEQRSKLSKSVLEGTQRIQGIVAELLTLDRRQGLVVRAEEPAQVMRQALHSVDVPAHIRVRFRVPDDLPRIAVNRDKIARALGNIIKNAVQAMPERGELTLSALEDGGKMRIEVRDTGYGMDAETMERIFDPFYTTREVGKGFGLGLAFAHSMIEQHGGDVAAESAVGQGTSFTVILPLAEEKEDAEESLDPGTGD